MNLGTKNVHQKKKKRERQKKRRRDIETQGRRPCKDVVGNASYAGKSKGKL